jgi:hypothetical protein
MDHTPFKFYMFDVTIAGHIEKRSIAVAIIA